MLGNVNCFTYLFVSHIVYETVGRFIVTLWVNVIFNCNIRVLMVQILNALIMQHFIRFFWYLNLIQPFLCFGCNQVFIFSSERNIFVSLPWWIFISSLIDNLLLGLTQDNFLKTWHFLRWLRESLPRYWDKVYFFHGFFSLEIYKLWYKYLFKGLIQFMLSFCVQTSVQIFYFYFGC